MWFYYRSKCYFFIFINFTPCLRVEGTLSIAHSNRNFIEMALVPLSEWIRKARHFYTILILFFLSPSLHYALQHFHHLWYHSITCSVRYDSSAVFKFKKIKCINLKRNTCLQIPTYYLTTIGFNTRTCSKSIPRARIFFTRLLIGIFISLITEVHKYPFQDSP